MEPVPDIVVLDFCEWLNSKFKNTDVESPLILDVLLGNGNNRFQLEEYAHEFLEQKQPECHFKEVMFMFFKSKEYLNAIKHCHSQHAYHCEYNCRHRFICCPEIEIAFHHFIKKYKQDNRDYAFEEISAEHLAQYTRWLFLYGGDDNSLRQQPPILNLMINSSVELSEELNFFNWLGKHTDSATDVRKMPSAIFEKFVDEYISETKKTQVEKKHLLKSYQQTGWEALLEQFQVLFRLKERKSKNLSEVLERYYSHYGRYKCIILPLSDPESQRIYHSVISKSWEDLNSCSDDHLDIYYSESDTGKSGFDIAKRINSLPRPLTLKAPCLIIWEHSMVEAKSVSISDLDSIQIVKLIKSIAENIQCEKNFDTIIREAREKVKELQNEKKNITNYYAPVITGDGNVVGHKNAVGTGNISGSSNTVTGNTIQVNPDESISKTLEGFEAAISAIHNSKELDEEMKAQLVDIMETAKSGVSEQSTEKQAKAKTAFGYIKSFLTKVAPSLVNVLANIVTIATFFELIP